MRRGSRARQRPGARSVLAVIGLRPLRGWSWPSVPSARRGRHGYRTRPESSTVSALGSAELAGPLEEKLGIDQDGRERVACRGPGDPPRARGARLGPPRMAAAAATGGDEAPGDLKATAHAGFRVSGLVPRPRRRHDGRLRPLVRAWAPAQPGRALAAVGVRARSARPSRWSRRSPGPRSPPAARPPVHGIHEFYYVEAADRTIRSNHAGRVRVPTLWQILSAAGREVVSLNLPMTYPPPRVRGLVVAGSDAPGLDWAFAQCPDFGAEIFAEVPDYTHKIVWKNRPRTLDELRSQAARNRAIFRAQAEAAERADARTDWSALMVHFHNLDSLQHRLWPYLDVDETGVRAAGLERRGRELPPGARRERRAAARAGLEARRGGHRGLGPRLRAVPGAGQRQRPAPRARACSAA